MRPSRPWNQIQQALEVSIEAQRKVLHLPFLNLPPCLCAVGFQNRRFRGYYHTLGDRAGLERQVHPGVGVHRHIHSRSHGFLEALFLDRHCVLAWGEIGECVVPAVVGGDTADDSRFHLRGRHSCPRHDCPAGIRDRSEKSCVHCLSQRARRTEEQHAQRCQTTP